MRRAAREFHDFETARHFTGGVTDQLAVLGGDQRRQRIPALLDDFLELEEHARAFERGRGGPTRKRGARRANRGIDIGFVRERHACRHDTERRVEYVTGAAGSAGGHPAADPV